MTRRAGRVRDREGQAVNLVSALVVGEFVTEESEERDDPGVARDGGGEVFFGELGESVLKNTPEQPGV